MSKCPKCEMLGGWHKLECPLGRGPYLLNPPTPPVSQIGNMVVVPVDEVPPQWADQVVAPTDADRQEQER